jgi:hypothetical protein
MAVGTGVGGFAGTLGGGGGGILITACYWDVERSGKNASAGGFGRSSVDMALPRTYSGWDFENIWVINGGYPRLRELAHEPSPEVFFEPKRLSAPTADKPLIRVTGRMIRVNAPPGVLIRIRLIDIRGRTVAGYNAVGVDKLPLNKIPTGKYIVEARERGRRVSAMPIRILK